MLNGLKFLHSLDLIHCDVKPENIMVKSYSRPLFKLIDLGSSCFKHDHLSSYVQSRAYRAPEVLLEARYDSQIDLWSFGLVLAELFLGRPLVRNGPLHYVLRQIVEFRGPVPQWLRKNSKAAGNFFTEGGLLYKTPVQQEDEEDEYENHNSLDGSLYVCNSQKPYGQSCFLRLFSGSIYLYCLVLFSVLLT